MAKPIVAFCNFVTCLKLSVDLVRFSYFSVWQICSKPLCYVSYDGNVRSLDCIPIELNYSVNLRGRPLSNLICDIDIKLEHNHTLSWMPDAQAEC